MEEAFLLYCTSSTSILAVRKWVAGKYHLTNAIESTEVARFPNFTVICNWDGGSLGQHLGDLTVNISWMFENGRIRRTSVISGLNMAPPARKDAIPPTRKQQKYKAKSVSWIRSYPTGKCRSGCHDARRTATHPRWQTVSMFVRPEPWHSQRTR